MGRRTQDPCDPIEAAIRQAGSIGDLERLAGIGPTDEERFEFWRAFKALSAEESLDAGVAELKRRIRATAAQTPRRGRMSRHA